MKHRLALNYSSTPFTAVAQHFTRPTCQLHWFGDGDVAAADALLVSPCTHDHCSQARNGDVWVSRVLLLGADKLCLGPCCPLST